MGRPNTLIVLTDIERDHLRAVVRARSSPQDLVMRAKVILLSADDMGSAEVAERCAVSVQTVAVAAPISRIGIGGFAYGDALWPAAQY